MDGRTHVHCPVIASRWRRRASNEREDRTLRHLVYPVSYFIDKEVREMCKARLTFFRKRKIKNT